MKKNLLAAPSPVRSYRRELKISSVQNCQKWRGGSSRLLIYLLGSLMVNEKDKCCLSDIFLFKIWTNFQLSVDGQLESLEEKLQLSTDYMYRVVLGVLTLAG